MSELVIFDTSLQFVNFHETLQTRHDPEGSFALAALMEVPSQLTAMLELGYFDNNCGDNYVDEEDRTSRLTKSLKDGLEERCFKKKKQTLHGFNTRNSTNHMRA